MANLRIIPLRSSAKECSRCLSRSRVIAAVAVLLTLPFVTEVAYAVSPNTAAVPVLTATVGQSVTCNPTSKTRPQPTLPRGFTEKIMYRGCLTYPTAISFHHKINNTYTRVYVAEKGSKVWDCDLAASPTCTLFSDLSTKSL